MNEDQELSANTVTLIRLQTRTDGKYCAVSRDLLGDKDELVIVHGEVEYRLRRTRQGKLILTK